MKNRYTYIALLRGINVSGQKLIRMSELKTLLEEAGLQHVKTYIQSGNIVFRYKACDPPELEKLTEKEIRKKYGFDVPVLVKTKEELNRIIHNNPFLPEKEKNTETLHITFLSEEPSQESINKLPDPPQLPDEFSIQGKNIYLCCPDGYGRTKLTNTFFESRLKVKASTRNWKTVLRLENMAEEMPD